MNWKMITDSEIAHLPVHQRFFEYAQAYRNAASALCFKMTSEDETCTWPNAAVVLLLAAHATELFLKGAIQRRGTAPVPEHHRIEDLTAEYRKRYPEPSFEWDVPFKTEYPDVPEIELDELKKSALIPSILFRYPVAKGGEEWNGTFGFEPNTFLDVLEQVKTDFERIKAQLR